MLHPTGELIHLWKKKKANLPGCIFVVQGGEDVVLPRKKGLEKESHIPLQCVYWGNARRTNGGSVNLVRDRKMKVHDPKDKVVSLAQADTRDDH